MAEPSVSASQLALSSGRLRKMLLRAALNLAKWTSLAERRAMRLKVAPSSMVAAAARPAKAGMRVRNCILEVGWSLEVKVELVCLSR